MDHASTPKARGNTMTRYIVTTALAIAAAIATLFMPGALA